MKRHSVLRAAVCWFMFSFPVSASVTHYVDLNSANPVSPYTNWLTAATNIQEAINIAGVGDTVLVTNGIYQSGGVSFNGTNRVRVFNGVNLQSVNGPAVTVIKGYQVPGTTNGASAVRCVYLSEFSTLSGFTLTDGATPNPGSGGGVISETFCVISNCVITGNASAGDGGGSDSANNSLLVNCVISGNTAMNGGRGGGVNGSSLVNCIVSNNYAVYGGGTAGTSLNVATNCLFVGNGSTNSVGGTSGGAAYLCTLVNCTVVGNSSRGLGAADGCKLVNSIIYYNDDGNYADCYQCSLTNCCTTLGLGNSTLPNNCISNAPAFVDLASGNYRLQVYSPCIDAGTNAYAPTGPDLDGNPRVVGSAVDMGAYENQNTHPLHYVSLANPLPVSPFTNWITAATNIQDAIDAAGTDDFIIVSNGIYTVGGFAVYGTAKNRVVINKALTVQSLNGPATTIIEGPPPTAVGMHCVYLTNGAVLAGFTLTNGSAVGGAAYEENGGGVWCESSDAVVSNCWLIHNRANQYGGGAFRGTLVNCLLTNNTANYGGGACSNILVHCTLANNAATVLQYGGGGAIYSTLSNCLLVANTAGSSLGGGAYGSTLTSCVVSNNTASSGGGVALGLVNNSVISSNRALNFGGGAYSNVLNNCILENNFTSGGNGGGAFGSTLADCTVVRNSTPLNSGGGGGINGGSASNSIIYFNVSGKGPNFLNSQEIYSCCTTPLPTGGIGNITRDPAFVDLAGGDFHLQSNSPCINAGNNAYVPNPLDLDGNPRIAGGTVDIGAYEYQTPASVISYAYLQQYGLPTDGSADYLDSDGDGFNNWQEWKTGTSPIDANSLLRMFPPLNTNNSAGITISWQSVAGINYFVQRGSNLSMPPAFSTIQSNIIGQDGTTSFTDTTATNNPPYFYRVGVP